MRITLIFVSILLLSGCTMRTQIEKPSFSGTVVDAVTGDPVSGVAINKSFVTATDGKFAFPSEGEKRVTVFQVPGAGWPVERTLTFHKDGYRETSCTATNLSLFPEDNRGTIMLLKLEESRPLDISPQSLPLYGSPIACQVFVGSPVVYKDSGLSSTTGQSVAYEGQRFTVENDTMRNVPFPDSLHYTLRTKEGDLIQLYNRNLRLTNPGMENESP